MTLDIIEDKFVYLFSEQKKLSFACLFLYLVFVGIGYAGLSKTAVLSDFKAAYLIVMALAISVTIILTVITPICRRAISYIALSVFQLAPTFFGTFSLIAVSLGNITDLTGEMILFYLLIYLLLSTFYVCLIHAHNLWKRNLSKKKYDITNGVFYPLSESRYKDKKKNYRWLGDFLLLVIVFFVAAFRLDFFSNDFKYYLIGTLSVIISFYFIKVIVQGFVYPLIRIVVWEKQNDKKFMIGI